MRAHKVLFVHPHSARSMILWDGVVPPTTFTSCNFVFSPGQKEVMKRYGYTRPIEVVGWTYCPILPFKPSKELRSVLFAPIHPNAGKDKSGRALMEMDQHINRLAFRSLYRLLKEKVIQRLVVRYSGTLLDNGLPLEDVEYEEATLTLESSLQSLQGGYDIVVAHQTFAYLAIASGIPTTMFGEWVPPHSMSVHVRSWDKYKNLLMYPLDLLSGDPQAILEQAACSDKAIQEWRHNFIGEPFNPSRFVNLVEGYMPHD
jgi:hypothetical protein